jgi:hypothetical protein
MLVAKEQSDHAGRSRAHEAAGRLHAAERGSEVFRVCHGGLRIAHADRRIAGRRFAARAARIAEHLLFQFRKLVHVLIDESVAGAAEAIQPVLDVGGVARLRQFTVIDQIDAGVGLLLDHLGHGLTNPRGQGRGIDRYAFFLGVHRADQVVRPRQATGMGGQKAVGAAQHSVILHTGIRTPKPARLRPVSGFGLSRTATHCSAGGW